MRFPLDKTARDLSRAFRSLRRSPAFAIAVVLILGLGIGMASAMFAVSSSLLLERWPIADQDRVVTLMGAGQGAASTELPVGVEQYRRYRDQTNALAGVAGYAHWGVFAFAIRDGERPLSLRQAAVTGNFFQVLGTKPALGRLLTSEDDRPWGPKTAEFYIVLSWGAWQRAFAGDPGVIGRRLQMPGNNWDPVIVGVAPPGLDFPRGVDYWIPANYEGMDLIGRLAPGATFEAARQDYLDFVNTDPAHAGFGMHALTATVRPIAYAVMAEARPALVALTVAVGLLLLLACVNAGNLILLRAAERIHEVAVRRALGAGTLSLLRERLAESILLAVGGGLLGLGIARFLLLALLRLAPATLPRADTIAQAGTPLAWVAVATLAAVLLFGLVPALGTLRFDVSSPLRGDGRAGRGGFGLRRVRHTLVASQIALALIVMAGAGLLIHSFARLARLDLGYSAGQLALVNVAPPFDRYTKECGGGPSITDSTAIAKAQACAQERMFTLHDQLETRLTTVPAIAAVSTYLVPPFLGPSVFMTKVVGEEHIGDATEADLPWFGFDGVGPDFFRTLEIPLLEGRAFTSADRDGSTRVAVVSEDVARTLWPGQDAMGKRFGAPGVNDPTQLVTVIGIVPDVHYRVLREPTPTIYRPYRQVMAQGSFVVRLRGSLEASLPAIEAAVREVDGDLVVSEAQTMDELIGPQLAQPRLEALLLSAFAFAAILLAAIGLYGAMARMVAQRTRELGVRMAVGATAGQMRRLVLRTAAIIAGAGAAAGLVGALGGARLVSGLLFDVSPADPFTLLAVSCLLLAVALTAAWIPAGRATRIDPAEALKAD
jgi:putative ABC transport system permease protein